jgi:hypothetical protein
MALPEQPVALNPDQIEELNRKLSDMRHNVNNHLSMITAAAEIALRKPEMLSRVLNTLIEQPQKITNEIHKFSDDFERLLQVTRSK